jgi:lysozyme
MTAPSARTVGLGVGAVVALALPVVAAWEGLRLEPYYDIGGVVTWCHGETAGMPKAHYSREECRVLLERSLVKHAQPVLECLPLEAPLEVKAAFASFAYNVGSSAACRSSAAKFARAGDYTRACSSLEAWIYVKGKRIQGLVNRRAAEQALCLEGLS